MIEVAWSDCNPLCARCNSGGNLAKRHVLLVEPDENDRQTACQILENGGYSVIALENPERVLEQLDQTSGQVGVIILPNIEKSPKLANCIEHIQSRDSLRHTPIIMRAPLDEDSIDRNLKSGMIFHHLPKQAPPSRLVAITQAAFLSFEMFDRLTKEVETQSTVISLLKTGVFELRTLEDVAPLATILSQVSAEPRAMALGLSELMVNAIEHGNLGISYEDKTRLLEEGTWKEEVDHRLTLPENAGKTVRVEFLRGPHSTTVTISDQGDGFDWQKYLEMDPDRLLSAHGRGIAIAASAAFDEMSFIGNGSTVIITVFSGLSH